MRKYMLILLLMISVIALKAGNGYLGRNKLFTIDLNKFVTERAIDLDFSIIKSRRFGVLYRASFVKSEYGTGGDLGSFFDYIAQPGGLSFKGGSLGIGLIFNSGARNNILPNGIINSFDVQIGAYGFEYDDPGQRLFKGRSTCFVATYKFRNNIKVASSLYLFYGIHFGMNIPMNKKAFDDDDSDPYFVYAQSINKRYFDNFIFPYFFNINYGFSYSF
ncbi:MAG: hypothetical protein CMP61_02890 [Flavobacteriales bacterium]|nr:hypothetical protein [Flavobacteriales bacterium]|tara:strand:+ start:13033 stop:13686 length:654 start_codon:yes stop_codon:yes gene_type:complete